MRCILFQRIRRNTVLILPIAVIVFLMSSCSSSRDLGEMINHEPESKSFSSIRICNYSISDSSEMKFQNQSFYQLTKKIRLSRKDTLTDWRNIIVQLDSLKNGLSVTFYLSDTLVDQYFLKGNWKNNFFYTKRRVKAVGIPPLFFFYEKKRSVIGSNGKQICLLQSQSKFVMALLIAAGGPENYRKQYQLIP
jgi:hypothetical protein